MTWHHAKLATTYIPQPAKPHEGALNPDKFTLFSESFSTIQQELLAAQVADFNLSRVMETSSMQSSVAATNPRYAEVMPSALATELHACNISLIT